MLRRALVHQRRQNCVTCASSLVLPLSTRTSSYPLSLNQRREVSSSHKDIAYGHESRDLVLRGVQKLAKAVSVTLGPGGRCVLIEQPYSPPKITKDGVTVAKAVTLENRFENIGARLVQDVANKTNEAAGDGTTTATVLAHSIYKEGLKALGYGCNPTDLRRGVQLAVDAVVAFLRKNARPVESSEQILQIATISANGDAHVGAKIAEAMRQVRKEGVISIKEGTTLHDTIEVTLGMRLDRGYVSPFFATCSKTQRCEYEKPFVLLSENKISVSQDILPALEAAIAARRPLLIIAEDIESEALALLIVNKIRSALSVCAVRAPGFGDNRREILHDIGVLTGAKVFSTERGYKLDKLSATDLGECASISVTKDHTTLLGGSGDRKTLDERCENIRASIAESTSSYDKERLQERLAKLNEGVAVISVGGSSEVEVGERKDRYVDALHATRAAVEEGVLPGGGIALLRAAKALDDLVPGNSDQKHGIDIIRRALAAPTSTIVQNAGGNGDFVVKMLTDPAVSSKIVFTSDANDSSKQGTSTTNSKGDSINAKADGSSDNNSSIDKTAFSIGYDAATERYVDMFQSGIIDPLKVVRTALVDASGVASLMTTAECVIVDAPKKEEPAGMPGSGMGGGMGGGMGF